MKFGLKVASTLLLVSILLSSYLLCYHYTTTLLQTAVSRFPPSAPIAESAFGFDEPLTLRSTARNSSRRIKRRPRVVIVVAVRGPRRDLADYELAIATLRCYAGISDYPLHYFHMDAEPATTKTAKSPNTNDISAKWGDPAFGKCMGNSTEVEFFFLRHCVLVDFMERRGAAYEWFLHIDADIGVVNPRHRIEEWIDGENDDPPDMIFYERKSSWEVMAGSYLARNTPAARRFLTSWAEYRIEWAKMKPHPFNYDNGALHFMLMRWFATPAETAKCSQFYLNQKDGWKVYKKFVACCRHYLRRHTHRTSADGSYYFRNDSTTPPLRLKLLPRWVPAWSRDHKRKVAPKWAPQDFMLHEWKNSYRYPTTDEPNAAFRRRSEERWWETPFRGVSPQFNFTECSPERREEVIERYWRRRLKPNLLMNATEWQRIFDTQRRRVDLEYAKEMKKIPNLD